MTPGSRSAIPRRTLSGPAMKTVLFFGAGILLSARFAPSAIPAAILLAVLTTLLVLFRKRAFTGDALAAAVIVTAGIFAHAVQDESRTPLTLPDSLRHSGITVTGTVTGDARFRNGGTVFTVRCRTVSAGDTGTSSNELLTCVVRDRAVPVTDGTYLSLTGTLAKSPRPDAAGLFPTASSTRERLVASPAPGGLTVLDERRTFFGRLRESISALASRYDFGGGRDLLLAMTVGDTRALPPETRETFTRSGIAHLLAVSGLNVAVIAAAVGFLLGLLPLSRKISLAVTGAVIFLYAGVCGFSPPITRALLMSLLVAGAFFLERKSDIENVLFAALLIVLAFDPSALGGASLQLSFASVWVLVVFFSPAMRLFPAAWRKFRPVRYTLGIAVATMLASLVTAPIAAAHFGLFPFLSLPVNIPAVPIAEMVTVLGLSTLGFAALGPVFEPAADVLAYFTGGLIQAISFLAGHAARLPFASVEMDAASPFLILGFALWLYVLSRAAGRPGFRKGLVYIPLVLAAVWTWEPVAAASHGKSGNTVTFFDAGQGDAALVECAGRHYLIDTGPGFRDYTAAEAVLIPSFRERGIRRIDGVFISHFDLDHAGGLDAVMRRMTVTRIFCRESARDSLRIRYGVCVEALGAGDSLAIPGGGVFVFAPDGAAPIDAGENARSLAFRFDTGEHRILFTGDLDADGQRNALRWGNRLAADVLKVPHHGAAGLDSGFVAAIRPEVAVISCGLNNRHGHPAPSTVHLLENEGCTVRRTDRDGAVVIGHSPGKQTR